MRDTHPSTTTPWQEYQQLAGSSASEKCEALGIIPGLRIGLPELQDLHAQYTIEVYLFFDEHIARHSTMNEDLTDYLMVPPKARPYLEIDLFFRIMEEEGFMILEGSDVTAEIIDVGEIECVSCGGAVYNPYIRALLLSDE
ncbi:MAG: hypothetical protein D5R99_05290 [Methanocalculus sp. MSAO_Arc1]|uniref:hypothetical protein n=1 Tax=Methanocalculus TaxID=71151 RepID=UPI000FF40FF1|nr:MULTISPECIES: hypothetical protein [unclassified Methanocalculus]MCP1662672.1 hypothetical protein [Methanocalculus sp. AMF5]RQD80297.1 MAG: hypothetical protein D5R99_05290 [Methanocalculus sp. MSAO_Arc1]